MKVGIVYNVSLVLDACLLVWTTTGILTGVCMIVLLSQHTIIAYNSQLALSCCRCFHIFSYHLILYFFTRALSSGDLLVIFVT